MKRMISILLCLCMAVGLCACGAEKPQQTEAPVATTTAAPAEPVTLTIGVMGSGLVQDYDTNAFTQWLRDQTGYDIQIQQLPAGWAEGAPAR